MQASAVFRATARVARAVRDAFAPPGVTLFQANGKAALQSVFHFHMHVLPRWESDGMALAWADEESAARKAGGIRRQNSRQPQDVSRYPFQGE
jgi:histidine triad (HIT) family protein